MKIREEFAKRVLAYFATTFLDKRDYGKGKLFLQDGDPRRNSKKAKIALDAVDCR